MRIVRVADRVIGALTATDEIRRALEHRATPVLGVATGTTPLAVYHRLAALHAAGGFPSDTLNIVALDEYAELERDHPDGFLRYVTREIAGPLGITTDRVHLPEAWRDDTETAAADFEATVQRLGGVDLQLLGIGRNGHIGFNEPGSPVDSRTRLVRLAEQTRLDNARHFSAGSEVPAFALTQGIATILEAHRIVMLAFGKKKADALAAALDEAHSPSSPAAAIWLHPDAIVIADDAALSQTRRRSASLR